MDQAMLTTPDTLMDESIQEFWNTIPPLWGSIRAHIHAFASARFNISVEQFHVLRFVRRGITTTGELAEAKNISRPAISQAVDNLVNRDLLTRTPSARDRRFIELALTPSGSELLDAVMMETRAWMKARMAALTDEELAGIVKAMQALRKVRE